MATIVSNQANTTAAAFHNTSRGETAGAHAAPVATGVVSLKTLHRVLWIVFGAVPIIAGLDKFFNLLTNWEIYLNPAFSSMLPMNPHLFMSIAGVIEVIAGIIVFARPRIGGYIVTAWLVAIALNLVVGGHFLDVAVRDLVMAVGAFTLANLSGIVKKA